MFVQVNSVPHLYTSVHIILPEIIHDSEANDMKNKILTGVMFAAFTALMISVLSGVAFAANDTANTTSNMTAGTADTNISVTSGTNTTGSTETTIEDTLSTGNATAQEIANVTEETNKISSNPPNGFSRFLAGIGDAFTFNETKKAQRIMNRLSENKLRILKLMQEKGTGLYNDKSFAAKLATLEGYVAKDSNLTAKALDKLSSTGDMKAFEKISDISSIAAKNNALDTVLNAQLSKVLADNKNLTPNEIARLNSIKAKSSLAVEKIKAIETNVAAKLVAKGVKLETLKDIKIGKMEDRLNDSNMSEQQRQRIENRIGKTNKTIENRIQRAENNTEKRIQNREMQVQRVENRTARAENRSVNAANRYQENRQIRSRNGSPEASASGNATAVAES